MSHLAWSTAALAIAGMCLGRVPEPQRTVQADDCLVQVAYNADGSPPSWECPGKNWVAFGQAHPIGLKNNGPARIRAVQYFEDRVTTMKRRWPSYEDLEPGEWRYVAGDGAPQGPNEIVVWLWCDAPHEAIYGGRVPVISVLCDR